MSAITANPLLGIGMHAIGAFFASTCYTPQKQVKRWSWQTYWLMQASVCWLLLPIIGAFLTIPDLLMVLHEAPRRAMLGSFLLGAVYGVGGTAFGISIRYIGFSLTYALAVGLSSVLGTLIPPLLAGTLSATLSKQGAGWVIAGIAVGILGISCAGLAGRLKENDLEIGQKAGFSLTKGLLLSLLAGVLSAVYGIALEVGDPIAQVASVHGAGVFRGNVIFVFSNTGAFLTTALYCLYLHARHKTIGELVELPAGAERSWLPVNFAMAAITGFFWYGQFFFYNLGHVRMGEYKFTSWAFHMIMLVLFSNLVGIVLQEWRKCRRMTHAMVGLSLLILAAAVIFLAYGNYLGDVAQVAKEANT